MARPEARYVTSAEMAELLDAQEPPTTRLTDHRVRAGRKPAMRPVPRRNRHDRQGSRPEKPASDSRLRPQHGGQPYLTAARSEQVKLASHTDPRQDNGYAGLETGHGRRTSRRCLRSWRGSG